MACVLVVKAIGDKKIRHVLALFCCIAVYFVGHMGLIKVYENRLGVDLRHPMPSILWMAMATQEGEDGKEAGWYNGLAWDLFVDEAGRVRRWPLRWRKRSSRSPWNGSREIPPYMLDFYKRKIVSQWSEPTYACQVETNHRWSERSAFMDRLYKGDLWKPFVRVMDVYQSLIYWGARCSYCG